MICGFGLRVKRALRSNVLHLNTLDYSRWNEITKQEDWNDTYNEGFKKLKKLQPKGSNDYSQFQFDLVMANPPFAGDIKENTIISRYAFGKENKGISFIKAEDIIITKVGTPCYASILTDYSEIALSRTVMGLTGIHSVDPYYLMVFLRCKYGFDQLFRQRELTIQYQLTLPRVKAVDVYLANDMLQLILQYF